MTNSVTTQTIVDGARNAVVKVVGVLDSSELSATDIVDPASFVPIPTEFRIDEIQYSVEEGLSLRLFWDASSDVYIDTFDGSGTAQYRRFGGLTNNSGSGKTGKIQAATEGWASTGVYHFTLVLQMTKMGV